MQGFKYSCTLIAVLVCSAAVHAQSAADVEVKVIPLSDNIHVVMGMGGNIGVTTGKDGTFIIDDDMPPLAEKIEAAIATISDDPVKMIFNTHWHFDHTGGNKHFGEKGAQIIAHDNVRERMSTKQSSALFNNETPASSNVALPVVTFDNTLTLHLNRNTIKAIHLPPAHTDGDSILIFEEANIAHLGDLFFNGMYPVVDISAGGSVQGMIDAIDAMLPMLNADMQLIPGHGPVSDIEGLKEFRLMLATVHSRVNTLVEEGKTVEEVLKLRPSYNYDQKWAWDFMPPDRFVKIVYDSAAASAAAGN